MTITPPPVPTPPRAPDPVAAAPSWWRRNLVALIALALLIPATALAIGWQEWRQYFDFDARPVTPVAVDDGETAELAGASWGPVRGGEIADLAGLDVPADTRLIAVGVPVDVGADGLSCDTPRLVEQRTGREWLPVRSEIGLLSDSAEPERCTTDQTGSYELIVPFVIPDDVEGPFWVDVWPQSAGGSFLRFSFEP
ncbi:hypothetical protein [Microbacterium sp. 179-I 3D3 NHS]|uniref:hypothetical protein n=1 Tax=Microbacterium sp. 179-I 3D3 NHS TaxID=3142382 RepID=UPI00399FFAFA